MIGDPFDGGELKYQSPQDIYEGICTMEAGEEVGILMQMFSDVSYENQEFYYIEAAGKLREKWDRLTGYDDDWKMELAVWQLDECEIQDIVWMCLSNEAAAKKLGLKKIFIEELLGGSKSKYDEAVEKYHNAISDASVWTFYEFGRLWAVTWAELFPGGYMHINPYSRFATKLCDKARACKLEEERNLIVEARALLFTYDDFMNGLRNNQYLYNQQEKMYQNKVAQLQAGYESAVKNLLLLAQQQGVVLSLPKTPKIFLSDGEMEQEVPDEQQRPTD